MIKIKNLQKHYDNFHLNCTMNVTPGRITGLIGQNGAGKSTLFKAVLGLVKAEGGEVCIFDKPLSKLTVKDKQLYGAVLSDSGFSGWLYVKDIISIMDKLYDNFDREGFAAKCERFGLPLNKKINEFSTGMKVKLKVITALSHGARLLVLDEPTSGLDVLVRNDVMTLLREFMDEEERRAVLISSHISSDLENLCDDIYMIHDGSIIFHEDTDVLLDEYALLKVDEEHFDSLDKQYLIRVKKETYGWQCLTDKRRFYLENFPQIVVEKGSIDELINMMIRGDKLC